MCSKWRFHNNLILKAGCGFLRLFQNRLGTIIKCCKAFQSHCFSTKIGSICLKFVKLFNTKRVNVTRVDIENIAKFFDRFFILMKLI